MKKTLLATAILSGLVSATAGAATIYDADGSKLSIGGRAEVRGQFGDNEGTMTDKSRTRINMSGETKISETLTGFAFTEYEFTSIDSNIKSRYLYAGLATQYGDFSYGQQDTANTQISDMTDIGSYYLGNQGQIDAAYSKQNNTFLYSASFDALTVQADYQALNDEDIDTGFGLSAIYALDFGLDLGASYSSDAEDAYQATIAAAYTLDKLYVAASYATGDLDESSDFDAIEIAVAYQLNDQVGLLAQYGNVEAGGTDTVDAVVLEANYKFNGNLSSFVAYEFNEVSDDSATAGLKYAF